MLKIRTNVTKFYIEAFDRRVNGWRYAGTVNHLLYHVYWVFGMRKREYFAPLII